MALVKDLISIGNSARGAIFLGETQSGSLTALGNASQANALALTSTINRVTTVTGTDNSVRLPAIASYARSYLFIRNDDAVDTLNIYPATGEAINGAAANAGVTALPGTGKLFIKAATDRWIST